MVAAVRTGEGVPLPGTARIQLTALTRAAVEELVGPGRAARLYDRSRGHPLFLTELAQQTAAAELPASLVESVAARCDELGPAGSLLRTAAVIGPELDVDLLAALSGRGVVDVLDYAAQAAAKQFLAEDGGVFRFRHELVREALAASASAGRSALLHRQAGRVLATRPGADPATVAGHARLGGDVALASAALCDAAAGPPSGSITLPRRHCSTTRCGWTRSRKPGSPGPGCGPGGATTTPRCATSTAPPRPPAP